MKPEWILIWPILTMIGFTYLWFGDPTENIFVLEIIVNVGIPLVIYFWLKKRQQKKTTSVLS